MFENLIKNISKSIVGNVDKVKLTLAAIISEGSILIEDNPGSGKTTLAKTITLNLGLNFKRIQFTSDLLPSDILGFNIYKNEKLVFQKGPIFTNIVLADELNRGFFVIATQNPMDSSGTSSLPDSQLDRFMISYSLSDLNENQKVDMLKNGYDLTSINSEPIDWKKLQDKKRSVTVNDEIYKYVIEIEEMIKSLDQHIHVSARCLKQVIDLAKGWAVVHGKDYVTHQEIKDILPYIFRHRIKFLKQEDKFNFINQEILAKIDIQK